MPRSRPLSTTQFCKAFPLVDLILTPYLRGGTLTAGTLDSIELTSDVPRGGKLPCGPFDDAENLLANICQTFPLDNLPNLSFDPKY